MGRVIYDSGIPERIRIPEQNPDRIRNSESDPEFRNDSGTDPDLASNSEMIQNWHLFLLIPHKSAITCLVHCITVWYTLKETTQTSTMWW